MTPEQIRFEKFIYYSLDGCWYWTGAIGTKGYGRFNYKGNNRIAHRISYIIYNNEDPGDMLVCHSCDNRLCVNPDHLWLGTDSLNMQDMWNKNRHVVRKSSRLCEDDVREIRSGKYKGVYQYDIAKEYGTVQSVISAILLRKTWKHVNP